MLHLLKIQRLRCQRTTGRKNLDGIRARFRELNVGQDKVGERAALRGDGYAAFDLDEHFTVWPAELYRDRHDLVLLTSKLNGQVHVAVCHREAECSDSVEDADDTRLAALAWKSVVAEVHVLDFSHRSRIPSGSPGVPAHLRTLGQIAAKLVINGVRIDTKDWRKRLGVEPSPPALAGSDRF